jgi:hypothetical protein
MLPYIAIVIVTILFIVLLYSALHEAHMKGRMRERRGRRATDEVAIRQDYAALTRAGVALGPEKRVQLLGEIAANHRWHLVLQRAGGQQVVIAISDDLLGSIEFEMKL